MGIGEPPAFRGQTVDVGRSNTPRPVATDFPVAEVISVNDHYIARDRSSPLEGSACQQTARRGKAERFQERPARNDGRTHSNLPEGPAWLPEIDSPILAQIKVSQKREIITCHGS